MLALDAAQIDGDLALRAPCRRARRGSARSSTYSAGMVASASSSNTQWPSGCCAASSASVAARDALSSVEMSANAGIAHCMARSIVQLRSARSAARLPERIAPSMVAGRPVSVQSPARQRLRQLRARRRAFGILLGRRREGRAALAHDLPRRQLGRQGPRPAQPRARSSRRVSSRGASSSRSAPLIVTDSRPRKREQPFDGAVDDADHRRQRRRRIDAEMRVDDGTKLVGRRQAGHQLGRDQGRHGEDHGVVGAERDVVIAEVERRDAACRRNARARSRWPKRTAASRACREAQAPARQSAAPSPSRAISGRHALPPRASVSRDHRAGERCAEPSRGSVLSAASSNGRASRS